MCVLQWGCDRISTHSVSHAAPQKLWICGTERISGSTVLKNSVMFRNTTGGKVNKCICSDQKHVCPLNHLNSHQRVRMSVRPLSVMTGEVDDKIWGLFCYNWTHCSTAKVQGWFYNRQGSNAGKPCGLTLLNWILYLILTRYDSGVWQRECWSAQSSWF